MMILSGKTIPEKMLELKQRTNRLAKLCPEPVRLSQSLQIIAISKGQSKEKIIPLLQSGHMLFGENQVQEAQLKWADLKTIYPKTKLHLIGTLQSNKIKQALALFDVIQTLDRLKLANLLKQYQDQGTKLPELFIQVNSGAESQKAGILPEHVDDFIAFCRSLDLPVIGLMCLPPHHHNPSPYFADLYQMAQRNQLFQLSMGMSKDLEAAILLGATHIRPGQLIFGERAPSDQSTLI